MNQEQNEILLDLLTKKATYGLDAIEQTQLDKMDSGSSDFEFESLEITAAAIGTVGLLTDEPMPAHLQARILTDADSHFAGDESVWTRDRNNTANSDNEIFSLKPERSLLSWFGWVVAAAACAALALNIWFTRFQAPPVEQGLIPEPTATPEKLTPAQLHDEMAFATSGVIKANWALGGVKEIKQVSGDVVWSDQTQTGFMRLRGLPVNDARRETYQLWIFDKTRDEEHPIDGGTFDINAAGEVYIPINAKLMAKRPSMFAITIEKPGGVVVSKREKVAALATVAKTAT